MYISASRECEYDIIIINMDNPIVRNMIKKKIKPGKIERKGKIGCGGNKMWKLIIIDVKMGEQSLNGCTIFGRFLEI